MKIIDCQQGTPEWLHARLGIPTASEFANLVTPKKFEISKSTDAYMMRKLAERWTGRPCESFSGGWLEQGSLRETEALPWFAFEYDVEIQRVGLITAWDGRIGCSPDGLIRGKQIGLECKSPATYTHIGYLLDGTLPAAYRAQVQGGMLVTGFDRWVFFSYCRGFPKLVLTVDRDESDQAVLAEALEGFLEKLDEKYAHLCEINGGPPEARPAPIPEDQRQANIQAAINAAKE